MLDVFFYGGSFMKTVTDMNVHEHLGYSNEATQPSACYFLRKLYTRCQIAKLQSKNR
jgi:hypothetical protein